MAAGRITVRLANGMDAERGIAVQRHTEMVIPSVIESSARGERIYDIYSLLLKERIVVLGMPINDQVANLVVAQLLWLEREDSEGEIRLYINSPGGEVYAG